MEAIAKLSDLNWGAEIQLPSSRSLSKSAHFVGGKYPCRSVAYIPRIILHDLANRNADFSVLDPFMGSGTTAIEAIGLANLIYGVEVDPYARLIATAATETYTENEVELLKSLLTNILDTAQHQKPDNRLSPSLKNIEYWFDEVNFRNLLKLKTAIHSIAPTEKIQNFLMAAFGDIIRACSKAERQSLKPYISTKYTKIPKPVFDEFARIGLKYISAVEQSSSNKCAGITWAGKDATNFAVQENVDVAITSPPYINAMDYTRCIKLESAWIGTADDAVIKDVRDKQLGESARRHRTDLSVDVMTVSRHHFSDLKQVDEQRYATVLAFFEDMIENLKAVRNSLKPGGYYFIIVGNSKIRGFEIPTHQILAELAEGIGYKWDKYFMYRIKDHRTSIPRGDRGGKIEVEHVIGLKKV